MFIKSTKPREKTISASQGRFARKGDVSTNPGSALNDEMFHSSFSVSTPGWDLFLLLQTLASISTQHRQQERNIIYKQKQGYEQFTSSMYPSSASQLTLQGISHTQTPNVSISFPLPETKQQLNHESLLEVNEGARAANKVQRESSLPQDMH